jgi:hypothetical protein
VPPWRAAREEKSGEKKEWRGREYRHGDAEEPDGDADDP